MEIQGKEETFKEAGGQKPLDLTGFQKVVG